MSLLTGCSARNNWEGHHSLPVRDWPKANNSRKFVPERNTKRREPEHDIPLSLKTGSRKKMCEEDDSEAIGDWRMDKEDAGFRGSPLNETNPRGHHREACGVYPRHLQMGFHVNEITQTPGKEKANRSPGYARTQTKNSKFCSNCGEYAGLAYASGGKCMVCQHSEPTDDSKASETKIASFYDIANAVFEANSHRFPGRLGSDPALFIKQTAALNHDGTLDSWNLQHLSIDSLPECFGDLFATGDVRLNDNDLKHLPDSFGHMTVRGFLDLTNNDLKSLPDSFSTIAVGRYLKLCKNPLEKFPDRIAQKLHYDHYDPRNTFGDGLYE